MNNKLKDDNIDFLFRAILELETFIQIQLMQPVRQPLQSAVLIVRFNTVVTDMTRFLKKLNLRTKAKRKKTMSYNTFAKFYDKLTENVEYKKRADYISSFFRRYADKCDTVLDLA